MANIYRDPTGSAASGAVDKQIRQKQKAAAKAARLILSGQLSYEEEDLLRRQFPGVFRRFLEDALNKAG